MEPITLPPFDRAFALEQLAFLRTLVPRRLAAGRGNASELSRLPSIAVEYAGSLIALEPDSPDLVAVIKAAGQAWTALFAQVSAPPGERITVPVGDEEATYETRAPHAYISAGGWLEGFHLACIARDNASLDRLCDTPLEALRAPSTSRSPEWAHLHAAALQSLWRRRADFVELLVGAVHATDENAVRAGLATSRLSASEADDIVRRTLMLEVPTLQLLTRVVEGDADRFDEALRWALEQHRAYWVARTTEQPDTQDASMFLAIGPLAMVSLAVDRGLPIRVDSELLVPALIAKGP
jgi:hypothetical protein